MITATEAKALALVGQENIKKEQEAAPIDFILVRIETACSYGLFNVTLKHREINKYQMQKLKDLGYTVVDELELMTNGAFQYFYTKDPGISISWGEPK